MAHRVFIGLGSNLAEPQAQLACALAALDALPGCQVLARSSFYRSAPVGYLDQPDFINAVAELATDLAPRPLLDALLGVERQQGRTREFANAPRTLDLDLLLYGDLVLDEPGLSVPHPQMTQRAFVLLPLLEIAPQIPIPGAGKACDWLENCRAQKLERLDVVR